MIKPYKYLQKVATVLDTLEICDQIMQILDEIEFLYEVLDPELQELAADFIQRLNNRYNSLTDC